MSKLNIINYIEYKIHIFLHLKNKTIFTILLQYSLVILLINLYDFDYVFCMTNDSDNDSEIASICKAFENTNVNDSEDSQRISDISSIFDYGDDYIIHSTEQHIEYITEKFRRQYNSEATDPVERALGPMFEHLKTDNSQYVYDLNSFDSQELPDKIRTLQEAYFSESIKKEVLSDALDKQTDQLFKRHNILLEAKGTISSLTQENLELKRQIKELMNEIRK